MLIIFFSVAEVEVCGSKIGDENPKDCCPPGALELLIATFLRWLIYSKFLARLAFDRNFDELPPLSSHVRYSSD